MEKERVDKLNEYERYVAACGEPPARNIAWRLYGAGLDNLGKDGKSECLPMPVPGPDEVLVRVDASGICASDFKVMNLGADHRLLQGRDLQQEPLVLGHEMAVTVVAAGENRAAQYKVGTRYDVLPGVYYKTELFAIGYVLDGGLQQYMLLGKEILDGDDGAYLAPLRAEDGYCESAMIEPWSCVVAAYRIAPRATLKEGGSAWFVGVETQQRYTGLRRIVDTQKPPARIFASEAPPELEAELRELCLAAGIAFHTVGREELLDKKETYGLECFDDIVCLGTPPVDFIECCTDQKHLANHGVFCVMANKSLSTAVPFNTQRPHYDDAFLTGTASGDFAEGYATRPGGSHLAPGGSAIIVGAGGPMGRMHVQLAVDAKQGPTLLVVCDPDAERVASLQERYGEVMAKQGRRILALSPKDYPTDEALGDAILALNGGEGYSDIVICAPVGALVPQYFPLLAENGVMNIFAGILKGYEVPLDPSAIWMKRQRILGSCGVVYDDFFYTLRMMQNGELDADSAVAAVAGIEATRQALDLVMRGTFLGKTVIYPALKELPLLTLAELGERYPTVKAAMKDGQYWCKQAEQALFKACLTKG